MDVPHCFSCLYFVQFDELRSDFQYNLQLLGERDAELERYDASTAQLTAAVHEHAQYAAQLQAELNAARAGGSMLAEC